MRTKLEIKIELQEIRVKEAKENMKIFENCYDKSAQTASFYHQELNKLKELRNQMNKTKTNEEMHEVQDIKVQSLKDYPQETQDNIFIVDCETGGLKADVNSLLDIHFRSLQSDWKRTFIYTPINTCEHEALCINNINWFDLIIRSTDISNQNCKEVSDIFRKNPIIIGHNIEFDLEFIKKNTFINTMPGHYAICTMRLAKKLYPKLNKRQIRYSLKELSINYVKEYDESKAHTAEYDCYLTENLLKKLLKDDKDNILKLKWLAEELKL